MSTLLVILLSAVLVCHYAPALLGTRVFEELDEFHNSVGIVIASALLMLSVAPLSFALRHALLDLELDYLHPLAILLALMTLVQLVMRLIVRWGWTPVQVPFALLMTTHCGVFGVALLAARLSGMDAALWLGLGSAVLFAILMLSFQLMQRRLLQASVPMIFRDVPLALITAGLMALALMGLTGLIRD